MYQTAETGRKQKTITGPEQQEEEEYKKSQASNQTEKMLQSDITSAQGKR